MDVGLAAGGIYLAGQGLLAVLPFLAAFVAAVSIAVLITRHLVIHYSEKRDRRLAQEISQRHPDWPNQPLQLTSHARGS